MEKWEASTSTQCNPPVEPAIRVDTRGGRRYASLRALRVLRECSSAPFLVAHSRIYRPFISIPVLLFPPLDTIQPMNLIWRLTRERNEGNAEERNREGMRLTRGPEVT